MIEQLNISMLDYTEMENGAKRIVTVIKEAGTLNAGVPVAVTLLESDIEYLQDAQRKRLTSKFCDKISDKDKERDSLFRKTKNFLKLYNDDKDAAMSEAANLLLSIIRERGWNLDDENYDAQSALLSQLFIDLSTPEAVKALAATGAKMWVDRLKTSEDEFIALIKKRDAEEAGSQTAYLSEAERRISRHLITLFRLLEMLEEVEPDKYGPLNKEISAINVDIRTKARARKTRFNNDKKDKE